MKITEISINRPVGTILIIIALTALGLISIPNIPVSFWPEFVAPTLVVVAPYPGVGPEEIEEEIAKPLEEELSTIDHVDELETVCFSGGCRIMVRFEWGIDFDKSKREVQDRTTKARSRFPREALEPTVLQVQDFIPPGIELGFFSESRDLNQVRDIIETKVKNRILRLKDVATVHISGGYEKEVTVTVDPDKLAAFGISLGQINNALVMQNMDIPGGKLKLGKKNYLLQSKGKFTNIADIRRVVVADINQTPILLQDIAKIEITNKKRTTVSRLQGKDIVSLAVREKSGGNTVAMVDEVKATLAAAKGNLPADIHITTIEDQSTFIKASIKSVTRNALLGAMLAGIIILLFLGNIRNTLIIALSIPISIIITFICIDQFGLSINTISLGGLALGVGLIVDSSIVVLENIYRHLTENKSDDRKATVINATSEVGMAITSATLTSIVVFLPLAFLMGLFAALLGELALTVVFALTISILVALTIVPLLSYKLMHTQTSSTFFGRIATLWQNIFNKLLSAYKPSLRLALRFPILTILISLILLVLSVVIIAPRLDVEMLPSINQNEFRVDLTLQEGTDLQVTDNIVRRMEKFLQGEEQVEQTYAVVGRTATLGDVKSNVASISVIVKKEYVQSAATFMEKLRQRWAALAGAKVIIKQVTATEGMEREPVNLRISGNDLGVLQQLAVRAMTQIRRVDGVVNLKSSLQESLPEFNIRIDHEKAAELGLPTALITSTIRQAVDGLTPTKLSTYGKEYDIRVKADGRKVRNISQLLSLPLTSVRGTTYPLSAVAKLSFDKSPGEIHRFDQQRVVIITADVAGASQRAVTSQVKAKMKNLPLPPDYFLTFGGQSKGIADSFKSLGIALLIAIFLVYVVMGAQFNSFGQPLIIAVTIPLALIGVFVGLYLFGASMSMNAILGMIMLVGIVVNNGILLVDYINQLRGQGKDKMDAIVQGGVTRLRPILITSLTTIFGMLPIALGLGEGGEALQPLGAVVVGGMMTSTFFTLLVIPCVYALFTGGTKRFAK